MCATVFADNEWRATKQLLLYPSKFATGEEPCGEKEDQSDELAHHNHQSKRQGRLSDIVLQAATRFTATVGFRVTKKRIREEEDFNSANVRQAPRVIVRLTWWVSGPRQAAPLRVGNIL